MTVILLKLLTVALIGILITSGQEESWPSLNEWTTPFLKPVSASTWSNSKSSMKSDSLGSQSEDVDLDDLDVERKMSVVDSSLAAETLKGLAKVGLPSNDNLRLFNSFVLSYDRRLRAAVWVMEHLTANKLLDDDESDRERSQFETDTSIHEYFAAKNSDFAKSGHDRGHLAAAGNYKRSQTDLNQTFILSNISPQVPEFNRGGWAKLEKYVRWRAKRAKNLYVVTGPLYLPLKARDGNLYVTYRVLGKNQVSVPTHHFKVFLVEPSSGDKLEFEAFLMPNDAKTNGRIKINDFRIQLNELDKVERAAGVIFFDKIPRKQLAAPRKLPESFREDYESPHQGRRKQVEIVV